DTEATAPLEADEVARLLERAGELLDGADVLCLEDYNKGVLTEPLCQGLIEQARQRGIPVLVDPAAVRDYRKYRGATCITPNRTEARRATGLDDADGEAMQLARIAQKLLDDLALEALVLTLDKQGAMLLERGGQPVMAPTVARAVYDVTGAGDMVLAMLAGAIANGAAWRDAVELANTAAGLEVERFGVVPIALEEVLLALLERHRQQAGKLRTLDQLLPELAAHRAQGRRIAFTNGCFDILHAGHVQFLREARRQGDLLVVGLNSDASIQRIKGQGRPVNGQEDRVLVLSELTSVDYIVVFEEDTPIRLIEAIRPHTLVKGADYTVEQVVGHDVVASYGGSVTLVPLVEGRSTTNIIRRIETAAPRLRPTR
ncbi:MAG TPA: D-glycero-beta-D-manno-heptose 1-phosphate adenylyltransferase, partial [Phycisphaeraceae bacterium]